MSDTPSLPPAPPPQEIIETRRGFYLTFIYGLQAVMGAMLAVPAFIYLFFPPKTRKEPEWIEAADLSRIPIGKPEEIVFQRNRVDGWKILSEKTTAWVVRKPDNQVVAFGPQCTHLGCAYHWDDATNNFVCPC